MKVLSFLIVFSFGIHNGFSSGNSEPWEGSIDPAQAAEISSIKKELLRGNSIHRLREYSEQPPQIQKLLTLGLNLVDQKLGYLYGSSDPQKGGMDCSGTIYYMLRQMGLSNVPRQANTLYQWIQTQNGIYPVSFPVPKEVELKELQPGDLLFWKGTYSIKRNPDVTHVMMYLGTDRVSGKRLMMGASGGRSSRYALRGRVDIFVFEPTKAISSQQFLGYGKITRLISTQ